MGARPRKWKKKIAFPSFDGKRSFQATCVGNGLRSDASA